jgi:hypothetical protein
MGVQRNRWWSVVLRSFYHLSLLWLREIAVLSFCVANSEEWHESTAVTTGKETKFVP